MYDFKVQLNKIKSDSESGSLQILNNVLKVIQEAISERNLNIPDLKAIIIDLSSNFPDFTILNHFIARINKAENTKMELLDFLADYQLKWGNVEQDIAINFLNKIEVSNSTILLHSNSRTIHALFEEIGKRNLTVSVIQTESQPGGEGVLQAEYIRKFGFKVLVVKDDDVNDCLNNIDTFLIGADRIEPENVINKVGSLTISKLFEKNKKPVYVLADSRKIAENEFPIKSDLFEKIPRKLITGVISEVG